MTTTRVSERREICTVAAEDGAVAYIGLWVDGVQIAGGVRHPAPEVMRWAGPFFWQIWSAGFTSGEVAPLEARDEHDVRGWLDLFADLAERGAAVIESRRGVTR